jgi:glycosyltransferase involved in cell wall biosynthesis
MTLSILIPTLSERFAQFSVLRKELFRQINGRNTEVEVLSITDQRQETTGTKRNKLVNQAKGEYVVFIDDDDWPEPCYIDEILKGCATGADCMAISGTITTNGKDLKRWYISIDNPYISSKDAKGNEIYLRYPNHITPIRREHALKIGFPDKTIGEDYDFATRMKEAGLLKSEHTIIHPIYQYRFNSKK